MRTFIQIALREWIITLKDELLHIQSPTALNRQELHKSPAAVGTEQEPTDEVGLIEEGETQQSILCSMVVLPGNYQKKKKKFPLKT